MKANMKLSVFLLCMAATAMLADGSDTYTVTTEYVLEATGSDTIEITRTDSTDTVTFKYTYMRQTAVPGDDFTDVSLADSSFPAGTSTITIPITLVNDDGYDPGEKFKIRLSDFSDGTKMITIPNIFIVDSELIDLNCRDYSVLENRKELEILLRRSSSDSTRPLTVTVSALDPATYSGVLPSAFTSYEDYAENGSDFIEFTRAITIPAGTATTTVMVDIIDDVLNEKKEPFLIKVEGSDIIDCEVLGIINNDDYPRPFHCNRDGQDCKNGGTCEANGLCTCLSGYKGADCSVTTTTPAGCDGRCSPGGFCQIDDAGEVYCVCKPGWTHDFCNFTAYNTQCNQNTFGLCISPFGNFSGDIYIAGKKDISECNFIKVQTGTTGKDPTKIKGVQSWCDGYFLEMGYDGTVDGVMCNATELIVGSNTTYISKAIVQYSPLLSNALDEVLTSFCSVDTDGVVIGSGTVEVDADPAFLRKQVNQGEAKIIDFKLRVIGSGALGNEIYIDDRIEICADVTDATAWTCVRLKHLEVNNNRTGGDYRKAEIYNEGCYPTAYESSVYRKSAWKDGNQELSCVTIQPFRFDDDFDQTLFRMVIIVHADLPRDSCNDFVCADRVKRQAEGEEEEVYEYTFTVLNSKNPGGQALGSTGTVAAIKDSMIPAIIGATVGGTLLVMATVVIAFLAFRRRGKKPLDM